MTLFGEGVLLVEGDDQQFAASVSGAAGEPRPPGAFRVTTWQWVVIVNTVVQA
jgi:hypothetical protein